MPSLNRCGTKRLARNLWSTLFCRIAVSEILVAQWERKKNCPSSELADAEKENGESNDDGLQEQNGYDYITPSGL
jgi:hypothetical protein